MTAILGFFLTSKIGRGLGVLALLVAAYFGFMLWLAAHDASVANAARLGYVELAEKTTAEAKATELQRQLTAANQSLADNEKQRLADELIAQAQDAQTATEVSEYEQKLALAKRKCNLDGGDVQFLLAH
ncbi:hypothetical protein [Rhizobium sp. HT1-10]|uniref:hypothetical protein n=1 Tax=Rhizobium sp. HT1-10 TaxID=3111638 RepID=UPI003C147D4D